MDGYNQEPLLGAGVYIGVEDRKGTPIHIGDKLRFDEREWGGECEFVIRLEKGEIVHPGTTSDLSRWCEVVEPYHQRIQGKRQEQ